MSRLAVRRLICSAALVVAVGWLSHGTPGAARADEKPPNKAALKVIYAKSYSDYVLVELYRDGKLLRTRELQNGFSATSVTFDKLAGGRYEVHFGGAGYKKCIKRIAIGQDDTDATVYVELDKMEERVVGGGPSLRELEKRIAQLEQANAELRAEIEKLKKK
jgi:hypothetical protein